MARSVKTPGVTETPAEVVEESTQTPTLDKPASSDSSEIDIVQFDALSSENIEQKQTIEDLKASNTALEAELKTLRASKVPTSDVGTSKPKRFRHVLDEKLGWTQEEY